jgi:uncharacterized protein
MNLFLRFVGSRVMARYERSPREVIDGVTHLKLKRVKGKPKTESIVLREGQVMTKGGLPLPTDIRVDRDVAIPMRDGVMLRADVYRPDLEGSAPTIVSWSPYGKRNTQAHMLNAPGVRLSGLQKFEGPDPAVWVARGYAVVQPDTRGNFHSDGRFVQFGPQEGRDGYDLTEWVAAQSWSNGKVGFAGNSWLAIAQWFIAAERPPHLAAIAPWEGFADTYRHSIAPGGVPRANFHKLVTAGFVGSRKGEDVPAMLEQHPMLDDYWRSKAAQLDRITVPTYAVASYANKVHTRGTIHAFNAVASEQKWLRIHNTHEWPDFYEYHDDLARFFDHFLLGVDNGWENTPRVRMSILDPGGCDTVNRPESAFPPVSATARVLHLDAATSTLTEATPERTTSTQLDIGDGRSRLEFTYRFTTETEIAGFPIIRLWVGLQDADDFDCYLQAEKLDRDGEVLPVIVRGAPTSGKHGAPYEWGNGILRLSHRKLDPAHLASGIPQLAHDELQPVQPGDVVLAEIELPAMAMRWRRGEQLRIYVSGFDPQGPEIPIELRPPVRNRGTAVIHTGGAHDSTLTLPVLPAARDIAT